MDGQEILVQVDQLARMGRLEEAEGLCRQFLELAPHKPEGWSWLGFVLLFQGKLAEAEQPLRQAVKLEPGSAGDWDNLSVAVRRQGRATEAEGYARQALALDVANGNHWVNLGAALADQGRFEEARGAYLQGLARHPQDAGAWSNLGLAELHLGNYPAAQEAYERSMGLAPITTTAAVNYAFVLTRLGQAPRAIEVLRATLTQDPNLAIARLVLGHAYKVRDDWAQAEAACRRAVDLDPRLVEARYELAHILVQRGALQAAEDCASELLVMEPRHADGWQLLGYIRQGQGRAEYAAEAFRQSVGLQAKPHNHSKLLVNLQYLEDSTPESLLQAHKAWESTYASESIAGSPPSFVFRRAVGPLRLGFVSSDFGGHPVGFMVLPALEKLDRSRCSVVCYSDRTMVDSYTARFRLAADTWRMTGHLSDDALAKQIHDDRIDILFDLAGHFGERLLVFAKKPAPMQVTWFGYVGTTGLRAIDFLLADRFHVLPSEECHSAETALRMPHGYACFAPPPDSPDVSLLPALASGSVTFGCFNYPGKYSPRILDGWAEILRRVANSKLLLRFRGLDDSDVQRRIQAEFAKRGIESDRIILLGRAPHHDLLTTYNRVDLALDTQPYSGGVTTCEALWMGVPVITWPGKTFAGRHATSHMTNAGYPQFVTADAEGYVELAVEWANRIEELAEIRAEMREQVRQSPLCDAERFAKDWLEVIEGAHRSEVK